MASSFDQLFPSLANPGNLGTAPYDPAQSAYSLGMPQQQNTTNVLQTLNSDMGNMQPSPAVQAPDASGGNYLQPQQLPDESAPGGNMPRKRLSLVDTIGRISDVLANVGGAPQQYQPYLDQRVKTAQDQQASALDNQAKQADIRQTGVATQVAQNGIVGQFANGVKAAIAGGADPHQAIAATAQALNVPPNVAALFGQQYDKNPAILDAFSATDPNKEIYGTQPIWFTDPATGKQVLGQVSNKGNFKQVDSGGLTPADTIKTDNYGNVLVTRGAHSAAPITSRVIQGKLGMDEVATGTDANGSPTKVAALPGSTGALNQQKTQGEIAKNAAQTAAIDAKTNGPKLTKDATSALRSLDNIEAGFSDLDKMHALAGQDFGLGRTALGNEVGAYFGNSAAQKRLEIAKNVNLLQQQLLKALPASATRSVTEQKILSASLPDPNKMTLSTARTVINQLRQDFLAGVQAADAPQAVPGQASPRTIKAPAQPPVATVPGGWKISVVK